MKKKSVRLCTRRFEEKASEVLEFCGKAEEVLSEAHVSLVYDAAIIKLYAHFEQMIVESLTGAINNDTSQISITTNIQFPKHLTDEVCEYIITKGGYFNFRGRDGLIDEIKKHVPDNHYLVKVIKNNAYRQSLDRLCALRNYAAHGSDSSKRSALKSIGQKKMRSAGSWLKKQNRLQDIASSLCNLSKDIEASAPY